MFTVRLPPLVAARPGKETCHSGRRRRHSIQTRAQQLDDDKRRMMENELKDSRGPFEFFLPRPLRKVMWGTAAGSAAVSAAIGAAKLSASPALEIASGGPQNLAINVAVFAVTAAAFVWEGQDEATRVERREANKEKQLKSGVREEYTTSDGTKASRLKQVDDKWIVARLERWGAQDQLPMVGPKKGAILQDLIREYKPRRVLEVGTFLGYSAILMAQAIQEGGKVVTLERDWKFVLSARRFLWQCNQGERSPGEPRIGERVKVLQGEACETLRRLAQDASTEKFDFLFIDGTPKESLAYLKAAEPLLAPGAVVVCDNVQVFEKSMADYLAHVREGGGYQSRFIQSTFEWRDDVPDGMEVSVKL